MHKTLMNANECSVLNIMLNICSHLSRSFNLMFTQMTRSARFRVVETGPIKIRAIQAPSPVARGFQSAGPRACLIGMVGNSCAIDPSGCGGEWGGSGRVGGADRPPTGHVRRGRSSSDDLCSTGSYRLLPCHALNSQYRTLVRVMQRRTMPTSILLK